MTLVKHQAGWVIVVSFIVALILSIIPLPEVIELARPEWTAMVLIYWAMALPQRVSVGWGWTAGIIQDTLLGGILGLHGLVFAITAYLMARFHQRLRIVPRWQQTMTVGTLLLMNQVITLWAYGLIGREIGDFTIWLPAITGCLLWPFVFSTLRFFRRNFHVF